MDDVPISKQTETQNMKLGHVYEPGILSENLGEPDFPKKNTFTNQNRGIATVKCFTFTNKSNKSWEQVAV